MKTPGENLIFPSFVVFPGPSGAPVLGGGADRSHGGCLAERLPCHGRSGTFLGYKGWENLWEMVLECLTFCFIDMVSGLMRVFFEYYVFNGFIWLKFYVVLYGFKGDLV